MPIVKLRRGEIKVPFDPKRLAALIYQFGFDVLPDQDTPGPQRQAEQEAIHGELRKLWGDKDIRTVPDRGGFRQFKSKRIPEIYRAPTNHYGDFMNVEPNPFTNFQIKEWQGGPFLLEEV